MRIRLRIRIPNTDCALRACLKFVSRSTRKTPAEVVWQAGRRRRFQPVRQFAWAGSCCPARTPQLSRFRIMSVARGIKCSGSVYLCLSLYKNLSSMKSSNGSCQCSIGTLFSRNVPIRCNFVSSFFTWRWKLGYNILLSQAVDGCKILNLERRIWCRFWQEK